MEGAMKKVLLVAFAVAAGSAAAPAAQEGPKPQKEHEWLQQLVGEWDTEGEAVAEPGKAPIKVKGSESGRMIGGFWALLENKADFLGTPFTGILTVGYDPEKKKYVATWFDSMNSYLWTYTGSVDAAGKVLTLETEGPCNDGPGKTAKFKESTEIKSKDHKVFTSMIERDGKWMTVVTINYRRKK
jgi:uncharacterized protein DUF1579